MPTFWDSTTRADVCRRVGRLTPQSNPQWGKFTAAQMLAHLNDAMRMSIGELQVPSRKLPIRFFPLKQIILYVVPFPQGAPTAPELLARCEGADLKTEQAEFVRIAERAAARPASDAWPDHPAFGRLSHKAWGKLVFKHSDHHLRQFGV